jgi:hypothetical protein
MPLRHGTGISLATPNAPVFGRAFAKSDRDMVARDPQRFEAVDDLPAEPSLGSGGATGKAVHRHQRRVLRFGQRRRVCKTMRLMHLKAHVLVLGRNPEGSLRSQRAGPPWPGLRGRRLGENGFLRDPARQPE